MDAENLTRAESVVIRHLPEGGTQRIYACAAHVLRTIQELGGQGVEVAAADPAVHGCKGCLEGW